MAARAQSRRDDRFDFLRGLALLVIFVDHVPRNLFESFTLHNFAFCDAAEVFFFISGYVAALVYGRVMVKSGFAAAVRKVWHRARVVYSAQMLLMVIVLALVWVFMNATGNGDFRHIFRVQWVYENPLAYVLPALTMHYQPGYLDILPSYVVLLIFFPAVLWAMNKNVWYVLVPSFLLWLTVQASGLSLWTTNDERWFFNPVAWQFLFISGAVFGHPAMKGKFGFLDSPWLLRAAFAVAIPIAFIEIGDTLSHSVSWIHSMRPATMMLDKPGIGALRLLSFYSLALIIRHYMPASGVLSGNAISMAIIRCGSFSLQVFSFGCVLSSFGVVSWVLTHSNVPVQTTVAVLGVGAQLVFGAWLHRRKHEAQVAEAKTRAGAESLPESDAAVAATAQSDSFPPGG